MRSFALLSLAAAITFVFAAPTAELDKRSKVKCRRGVNRPGCTGEVSGPPYPNQEKCMTRKEAEQVASYFRDLIRGYTIEQALAGLTEDFVDYSSAVSIVINKGSAEPKDITQPIFTSRAEFMEGHGSQQPIPFETLDVFHNCKGTVSMRWMSPRSAMGQETEAAAIPVPGLVILETEPAEEGNEYPWRVHTIYSEFNSAAWLVNLGVFDPEGPVVPVSAEKRDALRTPMHWTEAGII